MTDFPLLTLHPLSDARHRWVALLIEAPLPSDAATLSAASLHWLDELGLRKALGPLPIILPVMPAAGLTVDAALLAGEGTRLLRPRLDANEAVANAELAALATQLKGSANLALLLEVNHAATQLPANVQGCISPTADAGTHPVGGKGPHVALRIDQVAQASAARAAGWSWLGGNYAQEQSAAAKPNSGRTVMLKLLSQITLDADDADIEKTLKQDPNLSFQLIKLVNSAGLASRAQITSFRQAIATLGRRQLQRWLQLLLYAQQGDGPANPLLPVAAWRAGLMEALATSLGHDSGGQDSAFMVGMFSRLDLLFSQPLADVLGPLGLDARITDVLVNRSGPFAPMLALVEATEGILSRAPEAASALHAAQQALGIDNLAWAKAQGKAMQWALQICREL